MALLGMSSGRSSAAGIDLKATISQAAPTGVHVLDVTAARGELRVIGTAETSAGASLMLQRIDAMGIVDAPRLERFKRPGKTEEIFHISGASAGPPLPVDGHYGGE